MRTFVVINNDIIRDGRINLSSNYIKIDLDPVHSLSNVSIYELTGGIDEIL